MSKLSTKDVRPTRMSVLMFRKSKPTVESKISTRQIRVEGSLLFAKMEYLQLVVAVLEKPSQAREDLMSQDDHSAFLVEGTAPPTQAAAGNPLESGDAPGNAACRGEGCKVSIAVGDSRRSGSSERRLMDL
jgi:hypothetical protein